MAAGSAGAFVIRIGGVGCLLALQVLLTHSLGVEAYGDYIYAFNWASVLSTFGCIGLDTAALRFVPVYRTRRDWARLRGFLRRAVQVTWVASAVLGLSLAAVTLVLRERLSEDLTDALLAASVLVPLNALMLLLASSLRGAHRIALALVPQSVLRPVVTGCGVAIAVGLMARVPQPALVIGLDVMGVALLVTGMKHVLRRVLPPEAGEAEPAHETGQWLRTGYPLAVITGVRMAMTRADILLVGMLMGTAASGIYAVASQLATLIGFGLMAVNIVAAPLFSQLWEEGRRDDLQRVVRIGARGVLAFAVVVGGCILLAGRPLLSILFGAGFVAAYTPLIVLTIAQVINAFSGSVGFLMSMTGNEKEAARVTMLTGLLSLALSLALIPILGLLGAALATSLAGTVWNLALIRKVRLRLGIFSTAFGSWSR